MRLQTLRLLAAADVELPVCLFRGRERRVAGAVPADLGEHRVAAAGLRLAPLDVGRHPLLQQGDHGRFPIGQVLRLIRVAHQVVQLHLRLAVEVGLQGADQLPLGRAPAVLAHPGRLRQVELGLRDERLTARRRQQAAAVELQPRVDAQQVEHGGRHVPGLHPRIDPRPGGQLAGRADDQRHHQIRVVQAVMVVPALMLVQGLAVIGGDHHHRVLRQPELVEHREQPADRGVHVGDRPVVQAVDEPGVGDLAGKPGPEVIRERRERVQAVERAIGGVELVALVEETVERRRRQVRAVRVHVTQEQKERIAAGGGRAQIRDGHLVQGVRLGHGAAGRVPPAFVLQIGTEAARRRIAGKPHAAGRVAGPLQDLGQHRRGHVALVAQAHHAGAEAIAPGEHRRVGRRGRHARAEGVAEHRPLLGEAGEVRRGEAMVAVQAHVIATQAVDGDQQQVRSSGHQRAPSALRQALR